MHLDPENWMQKEPLALRDGKEMNKVLRAE